MRSYADIDIQNYAISTYLSGYINVRFRHIPNTSCRDGTACCARSRVRSWCAAVYQTCMYILGLLEGVESLRDAESRSAVTHIRIELSSSLKIAGWLRSAHEWCRISDNRKPVGNPPLSTPHVHEAWVCVKWSTLRFRKRTSLFIILMHPQECKEWSIWMCDPEMYEHKLSTNLRW